MSSVPPSNGTPPSNGAATTTATPRPEPKTTADKPSWRETYLGVGDDRDTKNVSWGAIFAGIFTTLALLVVFSLLGSAIGLGIIEPTSDEPFSGLGVGLTIWAIFTLLISIGAGGYVTGALAGRAGFLHGVVTWAGGLLAIVVVAAFTAGSALGIAGNVVTQTVSAVGSGAGTVASAAGDALDGATDVIAQELSGIQGEDVAQQTEDILVGTGVPELQPDYLETQAQEATDEVTAAGRDLLVNPEDYEQILSDLGTSLADRAETIGDAVDRDAIANSVAANTDLTGAEADQVVDNIAEGVETAAENASAAFSNADEALQTVTTEVGSFVDDTLQVTEEATNNVAATAGWGFAAALLALAASAFAGLLGARSVTPKRTTGDFQQI